MNIIEKIDDLNRRIVIEKERANTCAKCNGTRLIKPEQIKNEYIYRGGYTCECSYEYYSLLDMCSKLSYTKNQLEMLLPKRYLQTALRVDLDKIPEVNGVKYMPDKNFLFYGETGCGKTTTLYQWATYASIVGDKNYKLINYSDLLKDNYTGNIYDCQILIIDDFANYPCERWQITNLFSVINHRYEHMRTTWFCTNVTNLKDISSNVGKQIADRVKDGTEIIKFGNGSYRKFKV